MTTPAITTAGSLCLDGGYLLIRHIGSGGMSVVWHAAMVVIVLGEGRLRFRDIRAAIGGISGKVLTDTLRDLERDGLVKRDVYAEVPPRVEYELTALGHTLHEPLRALGTWAEKHVAQVFAAREEYDTLLISHKSTGTRRAGR